ncbi:hypothetical protein Tco_0819937 [Tanacetum coccineum]|uniref:Uncharacterized protein n=1 Tax=Tanacetum coccineum TaxID=301880 RepID=A0ABQ5ABY1_9ASTR
MEGLLFRMFKNNRIMVSETMLKELVLQETGEIRTRLVMQTRDRESRSTTTTVVVLDILQETALSPSIHRTQKMSKWVYNSLIHSLRALSTLRRSGLRTASSATKTCQGDSSEFYLITGSIYTDQQGTVVLATLFNESEQRHFCLFIANVYMQESSTVATDGQRDVNHNPMITLPTRYLRHHGN